MAYKLQTKWGWLYVLAVSFRWSMYYVHTHAHDRLTTLCPDYPGGPAPEETFTHSHVRQLISQLCVVVCVSSLLLHGFVKDFIRSVYLGQVIYNIEANISQATKSVYCTDATNAMSITFAATLHCLIAVVAHTEDL